MTKKQYEEALKAWYGSDGVRGLTGNYPPGDVVMIEFFGTLRPEFAPFPHMIFDADRNVFGLLKKCFDTSWGFLGGPIYDSQGEWFDDENLAGNGWDSFSLWETDENEEFFLTRLNPLAIREIRLSTQTSPALLRKLSHELSKITQLSDGITVDFCEDDFGLFIPYLEELRFVWLNFYDELQPNHLLLTAESETGRLKWFQREMKLQKYRCEPLRSQDGYYTWPFV